MFLKHNSPETLGNVFVNLLGQGAGRGDVRGLVQAERLI